MSGPSTTWDREKALFLGALEQPEAARDAWVVAQAGGDAALCEAVRSLLAAHDPADDFLETPAALLAGDGRTDGRVGDRPLDTVAPSGRLGPYRLLRLLGRGGMGAVYLAARDDGEFEQHVAIKVVQEGSDRGQILARFRHERQILAGLQHPNIARLLDGGTTDGGVPYFVMEYVSGVSIREHVAAQSLPLHARLALFRTICAAVDHAHRNLVVHRDIKASNIMVAADGTPKLLDFGIAKLLSPTNDGVARADATLFALTPECASPEQLRGEAVTTATDVYSLGVLLYELLTGQRPFALQARPLPELVRLVCEVDPPRPSEIVSPTDPAGARALRGDLDTIVQMAMHKAPARRYASVAQLAEDIDRHLAGRPVRAQPDTLAYRAGKFARRHRAALAASAVVLLSLTGGVVATVWQARVAGVERRRAERRFAEVRSLATGFLFDVHDAIADLPGSTPARGMLLQRGLASLDGLARESEGDTVLLRDLAVAYQRVGEVQGNSYGSNLGNTEGALASYRRAVTLLDQAGGATSRDPTTRFATVQSLEGLATLLVVTGDVKAALAHYTKAVAVLRPLAAAYPDSTRYHSALANLLLELGDVQGGAGLSNVGDDRGALASYRDAIALHEALVRQHPTDVALRAGLANALLNRGSLAWTRRDTMGAADVRRGVALLEAIVAERPDDVLRTNWLLAGYARQRVPLVDAGRYRDAIANDAKVVRLLEGIVAVDSMNALFLRNLGVAHNNLGRDYRAAGEPQRAVTEHRTALAIIARLRRSDSLSVEHRRDQAFTEDVLAEALAGARAYPAALAMYAQAIASKQALQRLEPDNPWHADDLAFLYAGLGAARTAVADYGAADSAFARAVPLAEAAVTRQAGGAKARATLAGIYGGAAQLHAARAAQAAAAPVRQAACRTARAWAAKGETLWAALAAERALTAEDTRQRAQVAARVAALGDARSARGTCE